MTLETKTYNSEQEKNEAIHRTLVSPLSFLQRFTPSLELCVLTVVTPEGFAQEMCQIQQKTIED